MKKNIIWLAGIIIVFVVVAVVIIAAGLHLKVEENYGEREVTSLPVVSFQILGRRANPLNGYATREEALLSASTLLPASDSVDIYVSDQNVTAKVYLENIGKTRLIDERELEFKKKNGSNCISYTISVLAEKGEKYFLTTELTDKKGKKIYYSTFIQIADAADIEGCEELLVLAEEFSEDTLNKTEKVIGNYTSYDSATAGTDLSYVNLNTSRSLLSWSGLSPKAGKKSIIINDWEKNQISISLVYNVTSVYEDETNDYFVKENFVIRNREGKLFLLDYDRSCRQVFDGRSDQIGRTSVLLGIQASDEIYALYGENKNNIYFLTGGGVWHLDGENTRLINVHGDGYEKDGAEYKNEYRLIGKSGGKLYFSLLGYVSAGAHEGENAFILYEYDPVNGAVYEKLYCSITGSFENIKNECMNMLYCDNGRFITDICGKIYSVDLTGNDIIVPTENADEKRVFLSANGKLAAWQRTDEVNSIYLMDMESGHILELEEENALELIGFIHGDMVYGRVSEDKWLQQGFEVEKLYDGIKIVGADLTEKASYEKNDRRLCDISLGENNVVLSYVIKDGDKFVLSGNDTLTITETEEIPNNNIIAVASSEVKNKYYYFNLPAAGSRTTYIPERSRLLVKDNNTLSEAVAGEIYRYSSYIHGECVLKTDDIREAMSAVYVKFGNVRSEDGSTVFDRGQRELYLTITLPKMKWTEEGYESVFESMSTLDRAKDIFAHAGVLSGVIASSQAENEARENAANVYEELELVYGKELICLGRCDISYLLYYINKRHVVLGITGEGEAYIITGYTSKDLVYYNPADRKSVTLTQEEAAGFFGRLDTYFVTY